VPAAARCSRPARNAFPDALALLRIADGAGEVRSRLAAAPPPRAKATAPRTLRAGTSSPSLASALVPRSRPSSARSRPKSAASEASSPFITGGDAPAAGPAQALPSAPSWDLSRAQRVAARHGNANLARDAPASRAGVAALKRLEVATHGGASPEVPVGKTAGAAGIPPTTPRGGAAGPRSPVPAAPGRLGMSLKRDIAALRAAGSVPPRREPPSRESGSSRDTARNDAPATAAASPDSVGGAGAGKGQGEGASPRGRAAGRQAPAPALVPPREDPARPLVGPRSFASSNLPTSGLDDLARALRIRLNSERAWDGLTKVQGAALQILSRAREATGGGGDASGAAARRIATCEALLGAVAPLLALNRLPEEVLGAVAAGAIAEVHGWPGMERGDLQRLLDRREVRRIDLRGGDVTVGLSGAEARRHGAGLVVRHAGTEVCNGRLWFEPAFAEVLPPPKKDSVDRMVRDLSDDLRVGDGSLSLAGFVSRRLDEAQHLGRSCLLAVQAAGCRLEGLRMEGAGARQAKSAAVLCTRFCRGLTMERVAVASFHCGVLLSTGSDAALAGVAVERSGGAGVEFGGTATLRADGLDVSRGAGHGVVVQGTGSRLRGRGLRLHDNAGCGLLAAGQGAMVEVADLDACRNGECGVAVRDGASVAAAGAEASGNAGDGLHVVRAACELAGAVALCGNGGCGASVLGRGAVARVSGDVVISGNRGHGIKAVDAGVFNGIRAIEMGANLAGNAAQVGGGQMHGLSPAYVPPAPLPRGRHPGPLAGGPSPAAGAPAGPPAPPAARRLPPGGAPPAAGDLAPAPSRTLRRARSHGRVADAAAGEAAPGAEFQALLQDTRAAELTQRRGSGSPPRRGSGGSPRGAQVGASGNPPRGGAAGAGAAGWGADPALEPSRSLRLPRRGGSGAERRYKGTVRRGAGAGPAAQRPGEGGARQAPPRPGASSSADLPLMVSRWLDE